MPNTILIDGTAGGAFVDQAGSDRITFGANAASLTAGQGSDTVVAGGGPLFVDASADSAPISVQGAAGALTFLGGPGAATITGGAGVITILPGDGTITVASSGQAIDVYSSDAWSGYLQVSSAASDILSISFDGAAGEVTVADRQTGATTVIGQGFAYAASDPGTLLGWTEPAAAISGLTAATHTGASADALTTTSAAPVLTGTAPPLSTVTIETASGRILGQPVVADALGRWQAALPTLPYGETDLVAQASVDSALPPFEASAPAVLHILPAAPSVAGFTDGSGARSGSGSTADPKPQIRGAAPAGATVQVFDGAALLGDAVVSGTSWTFTPAANLPESADAITAVAVDPASGAESAPSAPLVVTVDPAVPTVTALAGAGGAHQAGATFSDTSLVLGGAAEPGVTVAVSDGAALLGRATVTGGSWTFALPASLAFGAHSLTAAAEDLSDGAASAASATFAFTLAPPAPVVAGLTQADGPGYDGGTTADLEPVIAGTAVAGDKVSVYDGGALLGAVAADGTGRWQITPAQDLATGPHVITATDTATDGRTVSAPSAPATVTVLPPSPTVTGFTDASGATSGSGATFDLRPQIEGTTQAGTTVQVFAGAALLGDAVVSGTGWTFAPASDLPEGSDAITAVAVDPATGAASAASAGIILDVSLAAPTAAGFTDADGFLAGGATQDRRPVFSGSAPDGAGVSVYDGDVLLGAAAVSGTAWSFVPSSDLADGLHSITAVATDAATGAASAASAPLVVAVEPDIPAVTGLAGAAGAHQAGATFSDTSLVLGGRADPGVTVAVYDGAALLGDATVAGTSWTFALPASLAFGAHSLTAIAEDPSDGESSAASAAYAFTLAPAAPVVTGFVQADGAGYAAGDTADPDPVIAGVAVAGDLVSVYDGAVLLGAVAADGTGHWRFTPPGRLADGTHVVTAVDTAADGAASSAASAPAVLHILPAAPSVAGFTDGSGARSGSGSTADPKPQIRGAAPAGATVQVFDGAALLGDAVVSGTSWTFTPAANLPESADAITAVAVDPASGAESAPSAPLVVTVDPAVPTVTALAGAGGAHQAGATFSDTSLVLGGAAEPGVTVAVSDGAALLGRATVTGGSWTFALPASLAFGAHSLTAAAEDLSDGAASAASATFAFTLAPPAPVVAGLTQADGPGYDGGTTADLEPVIAGTAVAGDKVSVYDGGALLGAVAADGTGRWQITPAQDLATGPHVITATDTATDGRTVSAPSAPATVTVVEPAPAITMIDGTGGGRPTEFVTADARPTISGTGPTGATAALYDGATLLGRSGLIGVDGAWSVAIPTALGAGSHALTAQISGGATATAQTSQTLSLVVNPPPAALAPSVDAGATEVAVRASIATLLHGAAAVVYGASGQAAAVVPAGDVSGLSVDQTVAGRTVNVPAAAEYVSDIATGPVTVDGTQAGRQFLVATGGDLTYMAGSGAATLLADQSSGRDVVFGSSSASSTFAAATGSGDDVFVMKNGAASLSGGTGRNQFWLGAGRATVESDGYDTIVAGSGDATVTGGADTAAASGSRGDLVFGGSGRLEYIGVSGGATVVGGSGSSTLFGGDGPDLFFGGHGGGDVIVGGTGPSTLFGGGNGDILFARGSGRSVLVAGGDNATLSGGASTGNNLYYGGAGRNVIVAGAGDDSIGGGSGHSTIFAGAGHDLVFGAAEGGIIVAGAGNATLAGGQGAELYAVFAGRAGGEETIYNFRHGTDHLTLKGFTSGSIAASIAGETVQNGCARLVLSDGTRITFVGVAKVAAADFV